MPGTTRPDGDPPRAGWKPTGRHRHPGRNAPAPGGPLGRDADPDGAGEPPLRRPRRRRALLALGVTATTSAATLIAGLLTSAPEPAEPSRPLATAEAERLAAMPVVNQRDVRSGVHVTVGTGARRTELVGWVDWGRPLVYLAVGGPDAGPDRGLVQATPSAVVARPDQAPGQAPTLPPLVPPADRWRLRELPTGHGVGAVLDLLLALAADRPEPAPPNGARWLRRETTAGTPVDVLQAPLRPAAVRTDRSATPAPAATATPDPSRKSLLWIDIDARLHRLEGRLPDDTPVTVELQRSDRPTLQPVDALGGRPGLPRALTDAEAERLTGLPAALRAAAGATLTLAAPLNPTTNLRGSGWLSWADSSAYLAVDEADTPGRRMLLRYQAGRLARAEVPADAAPAETPRQPPLPPPAVLGRTTARVTDGLDRLVDATLRAGIAPVAATSAVRLRGDRVADRSVDVIALGPDLRYWIDRDGLLRRLELRTGRDIWAQLDVTTGPVPALYPGRNQGRQPVRAAHSSACRCSSSNHGSLSTA